jgi:hypothetical protein
VKKIASVVVSFKKCRHPVHSPPNMIVLEPGVYEHECPSCHFKTYVHVPARPTL